MEKNITQNESVQALEKFNDLLLRNSNGSMVLMTDEKKPIGVIKGNMIEGLVPAIFEAIKDESGTDTLELEILTVEEFDYGYCLSINIKIIDDGSEYESEFTGHFV